ncbi:MAG: dUTP diphosphatase [Nanoarchaeota archaeon]
MNTTEIKKEDLSNSSLISDKLESIFEGQKELMKDNKKIAEEHYRKVFGKEIEIPEEVWEGKEENLHTKIGNFLIKDMLDASMHELSETVQTMKSWKAWKQTEIMTDVNHWKEEAVDSLHFFIEAMIFAGITAEELHELYFKKHAVNLFRIKSNY